MTGRGRSFAHASEWDSHEDYNDSLYDAQYADDSASATTNLDHCRLYITNIPRGLNDEGLRSAFSKFGTLVEVYLSRDPLKKYGLLSYETPGEAKLAMMKMNRTEPLKLNINIAHKAKAVKPEDRPRKEWHNRSSTGRDRHSNKDETGSIDSKSRVSRAQETAMTDTMTNADNNTDELLEDDYGFADILDPQLTLELEALKMEQLKVKEEQLQCKSRMILLKRQEKMPLSHSGASNRCVLPDGKIILQNVADRSAADLDANHSAGAGDSRLPALLQVRSHACVTCAEPADMYCSNCGVTPYCSTVCQKKDWSGRHSAVCHNLVRLSEKTETSLPAVEVQEPKIQNVAPLRRPHTVTEDRRDKPERRGWTERRDQPERRGQPVRRDQPEKRGQPDRRNQPERRDRPQKREDDMDAGISVSGKSNKSDSFRRLQERPSASQRPHQNQARKQSDQRVQSNGRAEVEDEEDWGSKKEEKPVVKYNDAPKPVKSEEKTSPVKPSPAKAPVSVSQTPQTNETKKSVPDTKVGSVADVTPTRKVVPKNYLIEQLSIGDVVLLSVDSKASDCKTTIGDYVCLSMHEKFESDYQSLCEDYVLECDADDQEMKLTPGETCSYFNVEDGGWYRARCLNPTTIALFDSSKLVTLTDNDKIRKLPPKYEQVPEFSCVLESNNVELGANLKCVLTAKEGDGYKVTLENVETGSSVGEGVLRRWVPTVEYAPPKPVIPEVPRPPLTNKSAVVLVDATSLDRVFVRPADLRQQLEYDDIVQNALLVGRKGNHLTEPPVKGQTVIAKFTDGLHYRALCKRTNVAQNKYMLEYIDYGNLDICRNLEDMFPCPPNLDLAAAPAQASMIKLTPQGGDFTPPATEYIEKLKDSCEELILTLPSGESSAPSGSEAVLKLSKNSENVSKKIIEMCTPDWKKLQEKGGDVVEIEPMMFNDLEYRTLPSGPLELVILDCSCLENGMISGHLKGDPNVEHVFSDVTKKMAQYCDSDIGRDPYLPKIEELCIARLPPFPQWFRAVLLEQLQGAGGSMARVCYVDYGNLDLVPVSLLRKMLPDFVRGVPAVALHFEIQDFPSEPIQEQLSRAVEYLQIDDEGKGILAVQGVTVVDLGHYRVHAPGLLRAMEP